MCPKLCGPPHNFGYVAKSLMWRPPVFFREIPRDFATDGHITSRSPAIETGLAVHHRKAGVLAVLDRLAVSVRSDEQALS